MTLLGKITVTLSDDPRYTAGQTYDVVLQTVQTPDPSNLVSGSLDPAPEEPETPETPDTPDALPAT